MASHFSLSLPADIKIRQKNDTGGNTSRKMIPAKKMAGRNTIKINIKIIKKHFLACQRISAAVFNEYGEGNKC
jgi:hypothetical protein